MNNIVTPIKANSKGVVNKFLYIYTVMKINELICFVIYSLAFQHL